MQTFLVTYDLEKNFSFLDNKRLFKQLLEAYQILNTIVSKKKAWSNHPAVKAWKETPCALFVYIHFNWIECQKRGIAKDGKLFNKSAELFDSIVYEEKHPIWWGREDIIASHKSRLLCKGMIDAYCAAIKKHFKIKNIDKWLKEKFGKTKNQMKYSDTFILSDFITENEVDNVPPNWYRQFGWTENPENPYVWP